MPLQHLIAEVIEQLQGAWRYRWWAAAASWSACVVGWLFVYTIPDTYRASARVYVDTDSLIKPLMQGLTAQQNLLNEVQLVSTAVLTRPNLERVAREADLALRTSSQEEFEALVTALQQQIRVAGGRDNIFTIEYEDIDRDMARDVVTAVLETFVEDAIVAQGDDADISERALAGEIQDHEDRLRAAEEALAEFKKNNLGYMPGETGDYYTQLQSALANVAAARATIRQLEERRAELTRQIEGEEPVFGILPSGGGAEGNCAENAQIASLRTQLSGLLVDFTEKHPRVVALNDQIALLEERCAQSSASAPVALPIGEELELNPVYQSLRLQLSNTEVELVEANGTLRSHESTVARLREDVEKIAQVETELKQLNRDYAVIEDRHQQLLRRWEDLQAKKRLDPVTDSVQYRRIDPPFAFPEPVGPNRPLFLFAVVVGALALGGGVALGMSKLSPVCFSRRVVRRVANLPVLGSVSMVLDPVARARSRLAAFAWVASYLALLLSTALVVAFGRTGSEALRALLNGVAG